MSTRSKSSWPRRTYHCFNENRWSATWVGSLLFKVFPRERCVRLLRRTLIGLTFPKYVQIAKSIQSIACTLTSTHDVKHQAPTTFHSFQWQSSSVQGERICCTFCSSICKTQTKLPSLDLLWVKWKEWNYSGNHVTSCFVAQNEIGRLLRHENETGRFICFFSFIVKEISKHKFNYKPIE